MKVTQFMKRSHLERWAREGLATFSSPTDKGHLNDPVHAKRSRTKRADHGGAHFATGMSPYGRRNGKVACPENTKNRTRERNIEKAKGRGRRGKRINGYSFRACAEHIQDLNENCSRRWKKEVKRIRFRIFLAFFGQFVASWRWSIKMTYILDFADAVC